MIITEFSLLFFFCSFLEGTFKQEKMDKKQANQAKK